MSFFLKTHAIQNERTGASRTYLALSSEGMDAGRLDVVAFLTVAIVVADYTAIDAAHRIEIMGRVPGVETSNYFPGYLVAQLARDDRYTHEDFDASALLPFAEELMRGAMSAVGGRFSYIDCRSELLEYYRRQDYEPLYFDEAKGLFKLVKPLY